MRECRHLQQQGVDEEQPPSWAIRSGVVAVEWIRTLDSASNARIAAHSSASFTTKKRGAVERKRSLSVIRGGETGGRDLRRSGQTTPRRHSVPMSRSFRKPPMLIDARLTWSAATRRRQVAAIPKISKPPSKPSIAYAIVCVYGADGSSRSLSTNQPVGVWRTNVRSRFRFPAAM